jgi:hypothetical protein
VNSRTFVIRRLGITSLARWGFVAGALVACLPAFACSALFFSVVAAVRRALEGWRDVGLTFLGQRLSLDLIQLLHLQTFADALNSLAALGVFGILLLWLMFAAALGLVVALSFMLLGLFYNLTGKLELELAEK